MHVCAGLSIARSHLRERNKRASRAQLFAQFSCYFLYFLFVQTVPGQKQTSETFQRHRNHIVLSFGINRHAGGHCSLLDFGSCCRHASQYHCHFARLTGNSRDTLCWWFCHRQPIETREILIRSNFAVSSLFLARQPQQIKKCPR
jgi:hypothetical protein